MADTREGGDRVVFRPDGKPHGKDGGSAPQAHLQHSAAQAGPSLGTSSNEPSDLPDILNRGEGFAPRNFALPAPIAGVVALVAVALPYCLGCFFPGDRSGPPPNGEAPASPSSPTVKGPPWNSGLTPEGDLVRLHGHKERLIKLLLEYNSGRTDVLVKGRSGMTALVRKVCEEVRTRQFFDTIAWITVPRKYDSELIREEILLQLLFENAPFHDDFDVDGPVVENVEFSSNFKGRCLIVVDNLEDQKTQAALDKVHLSAETYQVIYIARRDMGPWDTSFHKDGRQLDTFELEDPTEEELCALFSKRSPEGDFPTPLKEVCQLLVRKFEILPTTIVLHLRNRKETNDEWAPMILPPDLPSFNLIRQVLQILYTDNRRFCLLLLSIFPENRQINCARVSRLCVAEGLLPDLGEAEDFLNDLLDRKCIHREGERSDGKLSTFRLDNLVREIIVSLSDHPKQIRITSQGSAHWPESVRYLSVPGTIMDLKEEKPFQLSSIFALDVSSNEERTTISRASSLETSETLPPFDLKHSKVLDLTGAPFQIVPDGFSELRYIGLRNTQIKVIPRSIGKLERLEFLDAKHSLVTKLPPQVGRLTKVRHILIYHYEEDPLMESCNLVGFKALCSVRGLKDLEKLCFVEADEITLKDLGSLTKLKRLGITKLRKEHGKLLCFSLEKLKELKSLNIHAFNEDEMIDLQALSSPLINLNHLYLHGRLGKLPEWVSSCSLQYLAKLILRWSHVKRHLLATLGELPELVELQLFRAYDGERLDFKTGQFPKLKILLLEELEGLTSISLEQGTLKSLETLTISRCPWLDSIPSGIGHIVGIIQKLTFFDMSDEFYEKVPEDHEKEDYEKMKDIKEVYFRRWRADHWETPQVESTGEGHYSNHGESTGEAHCSHQGESTNGNADGIRLLEA